jgi:hypothetical protein
LAHVIKANDALDHVGDFLHVIDDESALQGAALFQTGRTGDVSAANKNVRCVSESFYVSCKVAAS